MANFGRGAVRDIVDFCLFDTVTGKPVLFLDSLRMSTLEIGAETVYARGGRGNPRRIGWDASKDVDIQGEDCLISPEQLSLLLGSTLATGTQYVPITERQVITGTSMTLTGTPYRAALSTYPMSIFTNSNNDGSTIGTEIAYAATPSAGEYGVSGTTVTFGTSYSNQSIIVTYYKAASALNKRITVTSDQFPLTFKCTGYTLWRDEATGKDFPCRITIPKAKLLAPFTMKQEATGDPSTFTMKFTALKDSATNTMIIYDLESDTPIN
jgi:hypothetical protein